MQVKWLKRAIRDFEQEALYVQEENPASAQAMAKAMRAALDSLTEFPSLGRPGRVPGTRELVIDGFPYVIPYRVRGDVIQVIRVFHTSRRLPPKRW
jgi:addiction module RelE/StbE family toxin